MNSRLIVWHCYMKHGHPRCFSIVDIMNPTERIVMITHFCSSPLFLLFFLFLFFNNSHSINSVLERCVYHVLACCVTHVLVSSSDPSLLWIFRWSYQTLWEHTVSQSDTHTRNGTRRVRAGTHSRSSKRAARKRALSWLTRGERAQGAKREMRWRLTLCKQQAVTRVVWALTTLVPLPTLEVSLTSVSISTSLINNSDLSSLYPPLNVDNCIDPWECLLPLIPMNRCDHIDSIVSPPRKSSKCLSSLSSSLSLSLSIMFYLISAFITCVPPAKVCGTDRQKDMFVRNVSTSHTAQHDSS